MTLREQVRSNTLVFGSGILAAVLLAVTVGVLFKARGDYNAAAVAHERAEVTRRHVAKMLGFDKEKTPTDEELEARATEANKILAMLSAPAVFQGRALSVDAGDGKTRALTVGELVAVVAQERAAVILQSQAQQQNAGAQPPPKK